MFGTIIYVSLFLQVVHGTTPTASGLKLLPLMGGLLVASIGSGRTISKIGRYRAFPIAGTAFVSVGMYLLSRIGVSTGYLLLSVAMVVLGFGLGLVMPVLVLAVQNAVPPAGDGRGDGRVDLLPLDRRRRSASRSSGRSSPTASVSGCRTTSRRART